MEHRAKLMSCQASKRLTALKGLTGVAVLVFASSSIYLALELNIDYFDSHNFLLQARRLTDASYQFVDFDSRRPRTLVALLSIFNAIHRAFFSKYPSLQSYHLLMSSFSVAFFFTWWFLARRFWGTATACVGTLFLVANQILVHYSIFLLSDYISGLLWGVTIWVFGSIIQKKQFLARQAIMLGILGAFTGLTKNHYLILYPLLLLIYVFFLMVNRQSSATDSMPNRKWIGLTLASYVFSLDIINRAFGRWSQGVITHLVNLYKQAIHSFSEPTSPWIYLDAMYQMYGPVFGVLALLSVAIYLQKNFRQEIVTALNKPLVASVSLCTLFYLVLTQWISHREIRYLIPFFPVLFFWIAHCAIITIKSLPRPQQYIGLSLWVFALWTPLHASVQDYLRYFEDPTYKNAETEFDRLWNSIHETQCKRIYACRFALRSSKKWEFPLDPYYRQYDVEPQYRWFTGLPTRVMDCPRRPAPLLELLVTLKIPLQQDTCYLISNGDSKKLTLFNFYDNYFNRAQYKQSQALVKPPYCEKHSSGKDTWTCFSQKSFFHDLTQNLQ